MSLPGAERKATEELELEIHRLRDDVSLLQSAGQAANRLSCDWNQYHRTQERNFHRSVEPLLQRYKAELDLKDQILSDARSANKNTKRRENELQKNKKSLYGR